jgi:hypothetical protein
VRADFPAVRPPVPPASGRSARVISPPFGSLHAEAVDVPGIFFHATSDLLALSRRWPEAA